MHPLGKAGMLSAVIWNESVFPLKMGDVPKHVPSMGIYETDTPWLLQLWPPQILRGTPFSRLDEAARGAARGAAMALEKRAAMRRVEKLIFT